MTIMTYNEVVFSQAKMYRPETSQDWIPVLKLSNVFSPNAFESLNKE